MVYIEGSIQSRQWEDQDGNKRTSFDIRARDMVLLGSPGGGGGGGQQGRSGTSSDAEAGGGGQQGRSGTSSDAEAGGGTPAITDDDIPF